MKSNYIFYLVILALPISSCFTVKSNAHFTYKKIKQSEYAQLLKDSSNYYLIDVRTKSEYNKSHLENALNNSYLSFHYGRNIDSLDRNKVAFIYCQTCHRSPLAARAMKRKGFRKVYDLRGGYSQWKS